MSSVALTLRSTVVFMVVLSVSTQISGQTPIQSLDRRDPVYVQQQQMVRRTDTPLILFAYTPKENEDLFAIASRVTLPYSTIASLNRLDRPELPKEGTQLLLPNQPGLFAPAQANTQLERRLLQRISREEQAAQVTIPSADGDSTFLFAPEMDFTREERDLFMRGTFIHPIGSAPVSSSFGYRYHPFSGARLLHTGIDFAADFGTPVYAVADGVVQEINREPFLGLSVLVAHRGAYETMYAHLQEATVAVGEQLAAGDTLGFVGSTGMSTGPHLHFEVRFEGVPHDPEQYILWK